MNKSELLADLATENTWIGTPEVQCVHPDGTKWYKINVRERVGDAGINKNVDFYVFDEGGAGEDAYYKDKRPDKTSRASDFQQWMLAQIDAEPNDWKGVQIHWLSERWQMVIYTVLTGSPLQQKTYYVRKGHGAPVEISNFNLGLINSREI